MPGSCRCQWELLCRGHVPCCAHQPAHAKLLLVLETALCTDLCACLVTSDLVACSSHCLQDNSEGKAILHRRYTAAAGKPSVENALHSCRANRARGCSPLTLIRGMPVPFSMLIGTRIQGNTGSALVFATVSCSAGADACSCFIGLIEGAAGTDMWSDFTVYVCAAPLFAAEELTVLREGGVCSPDSFCL